MAIRGYLAMTRAEFRLFRREPFSIVFVLAFPLMMMTLLSAVFGDDPAEAESVENGVLIWRGVTPNNYYTAASVAVIIAALGLMALPINPVGYRERGILRRFRASSVSAWVLVCAQLTLALVTFVAGGAAARPRASVSWRSSRCGSFRARRHRSPSSRPACATSVACSRSPTS